MRRGKGVRQQQGGGTPTSEGPVVERMTVPAEVEIRLARPSDITGLETWEGFNTPAHRRALRYYLNMQEAQLGAFIIAAVDEHPVAQLFLWYHRDDPSLADGSDTVSITALRVRPAFRKRGIATRMAEVAERIAARIGFRTVTIGTDVDNEPAHRLYLSWGYEEFKRSTYEWDGKTYPQICLRKRLSQHDEGSGAPPTA